MGSLGDKNPCIFKEGLFGHWTRRGRCPIGHRGYRVVVKKFLEERHIVEPRGFFLIERESILVGN